MGAELTVNRAEVAQYEPFTVQLTVRNTSSDTVHIGTAHSCLALPHIMRDDERVPFHGTALGCMTVISTHSFAPGEVVTLEWELRAELYAEKLDEVQGAPAPEGRYTVRVEFETQPVDGVERRPAVEAELRVKDEVWEWAWTVGGGRG